MCKRLGRPFVALGTPGSLAQSTGRAPAGPRVRFFPLSLQDSLECKERLKFFVMVVELGGLVYTESCVD